MFGSVLDIPIQIPVPAGEADGVLTYPPANVGVIPSVDRVGAGAS